MQNQQDFSTWAILGPGAIGLLWASYFVRSQQPVQLLCQANTALTIQQNLTTIQLETQHRQEQYILPAFRIPQLPSSLGLVLVTTKAFSTVSALQTIQGSLSPQSVILLMQNGMGIYEEVHAAFPQYRIFVASTTNGAYRSRVNTVLHTGWGDTFIGTLDAEQPDSLANAILQKMQSTGLSVHWEPNIRLRLWKKLIINCGINSLTAIWKCRNGKLLAHPTGKKLLWKISEECSAVMSASLQQHISAEDSFRWMQSAIEQSSQNYSSMCEDLRYQRPTEIEYIQNYTLRKAAQLGISCPILETLTQLIQQIKSH